jgi:hypothetical protein
MADFSITIQCALHRALELWKILLITAMDENNRWNQNIGIDVSMNRCRKGSSKLSNMIYGKNKGTMVI